MDNKNIIIIVLIIIILVFGGILALKIFTVKSIEVGSDYAVEKAIEKINTDDLTVEDIIKKGLVILSK